MIDVTEILMDPDFSDRYTVRRTTGRWKAGRFVKEKHEDIPYAFPAHPATEEELEQISEGDRKKEVMTFFCVRPKTFYISEPVECDDDIAVYDFIHHKGNVYKLIKIKDWASHGWMRGYGVLIGPIGKE